MTLSAKEVKTLLKEHGISVRHIRVRVESVGYGSLSIRIRLLDIALDCQRIETIVRREYQEIREDEHVQGEYLQGCNTYVQCQYDYDVFDQAVEALYPRAKELYAYLETQNGYQGIEIFENEDVQALAFYKDHLISLKNKKDSTVFYRNRAFYSEHDLAEILVTLEHGHIFGAA
ncbi:hypothetical protein [Enterococcus avium]|uniref:hypothetical protein n=1 Tax=Enterococcus avium TaxID=33945 RepID=UPI000F4E1ADA|nr:hypothetical protein [Enterococcus avium]MDT2432217.1 hypothetical protein [Enterococcus avium]MDT2449873.1 hypothetical protein [Enterococcus avium]MDT2493797.1 hypothetical protein [Enterococcus avium]ROZ48238.1 hypothetical protein EGX28_02570 [Enterococcus avium]